ncbi:MAG: cysteine peptidase family C39 domain-containing protein [Acidobacteriota bacterium]|nr:cysteine peptidase family C39 domain-containing protein [Acidobacteriota bacterium]
MVLLGFGQDVSEAELRQLCDCTFAGTNALKAVDAARQLGFPGTVKHNMTLKELAAVVADGYFPIVFVEMKPITNVYEPHALVVTGVNDFSVEVIDPALGEARILARSVFDTAWALRRRLAIIVKP